MLISQFCGAPSEIPAATIDSPSVMVDSSSCAMLPASPLVDVLSLIVSKRKFVTGVATTLCP